MFVSSGVIRYSRNPLGDDGWWIVLDIDPSIGKYYRSLSKFKKLTKPSWGDHITINYGEKPANDFYWNKYDGQTIDYCVTIDYQTNGEAWYFPAYCGLFDIIRIELGLGRPIVPFHLTIGYEE